MPVFLVMSLIHFNIFVGGILLGSSELVLFTMTVERYMGLTRPLFHKTSVTKRRIIIFKSITHVFYFIIEICNFTLEIPSITEAYIHCAIYYTVCCGGFYVELQNVCHR
jgi:hypothetical protein